jgi:hypothetical protein
MTLANGHALGEGMGKVKALTGAAVALVKKLDD